jgi:hypothetical protein
MPKRAEMFLFKNYSIHTFVCNAIKVCTFIAVGVQTVSVLLYTRRRKLRQCRWGKGCARGTECSSASRPAVVHDGFQVILQKKKNIQPCEVWRMWWPFHRSSSTDAPSRQKPVINTGIQYS